MSGTGLGITLGIIYLFLLLTLALLSFRKGHWVLGLFGFIFPLLWLVGALLPARRYRRGTGPLPPGTGDAAGRPGETTIPVDLHPEPVTQEGVTHDSERTGHRP